MAFTHSLQDLYRLYNPQEYCYSEGLNDI